MKKHRTRAKTATLSFPFKNDADAVDNNVGGGDQHFMSQLGGYNAAQRQKTRPVRPMTIKQDVAFHSLLDLDIITRSKINSQEIGPIESKFMNPTTANSSLSSTLRKPPTLNPKLKFLKSQAQTRNSASGYINNPSLPIPPLKSPHLATSKKSTAQSNPDAKISRKSKQFSPRTTSSYYSITTSDTILKAHQYSTTIPIPSALPSSYPPKSKQLTGKSKGHSSTSTPIILDDHEQQKHQKHKLTVTTTTNEVDQLKLTPRNADQVKSVDIIQLADTNPSRIFGSNGNGGGKRYHICRTLEEREQNPDTIYLDKFNLKHFPSIDSAETQLRLLSLQNNLIHRIDFNNLTIQSNLLVLDLYNNRIDRITGLHIFSSLKVLLLGKNRIRRVEGLDTLKHLEILDLHGNQLRYLDNINTLISLRVLNVAGNLIRSIRNFGPYGISSLTELNLKRNHIQNLAGILKIVHLKKLCLGNNNIESISVLYPLKKLEHLQEILVDPNPICELPDYKNQILALLVNLEILDTAPVSEEMKSDAQIWHRKKLEEEHERRKEMDKLKFLSTTSTRDEVILKARRRWESVRNYVKQNSVGSGKNSSRKESLNRVPSERRISVQEAAGNDNKFTVELEVEVETKSKIFDEPIKKYLIEPTLVKESSLDSHNLNSLKPEVDPTLQHDTSAEVSTVLNNRSNSGVLTKIAIVRPSIRPKTTSVAVGSILLENPISASQNKPMLADANTGQSIIKEDENEDAVSEVDSKFVSSEIIGANEKYTLIGKDVPCEISQTIENRSKSLNKPSSGQPEFPPVVIPPQNLLKLPEKRPIIRRSLSTNLLPLFPISQSQERQSSRRFLPSAKSNFNQDKLMKTFHKNRSKSITDLTNQHPASNDSDTTSDIESVTTITSVNTTSDTGSTTTATTPRKPMIRPKLVRSNSSRQLLKPRGKTGRIPSGANFPNSSLNSRRPFTSTASNTNLAKTEHRGVLRRSESSANLESSFTTMPDVVVKKQGADYLVEINGKLLNIYGQGALKHTLTAFSANATGNISTVTFHFITFDSIIPYFSKLRQVYPSLEHFHFRANGLGTLAQLNALADLQGITTLYVFQDGNPLVENIFFQDYAAYRLGHWGLQQVNGNDVSSNYRTIGSGLTESGKNAPLKTFDSLGYLALSCLPQSALTPLAERLHMLHCFCCCSTSNSSEESGKKKSDGPSSITNTCASYWDDDPVLLDVIGKEALVYVPQMDAKTTQQQDVATEIFESGCEIIEKLHKLDEIWPTLMIEVIEDVLLDYQVMDNFMKKELIGLKNTLTANCTSTRKKAK